MNLSGEKMLEAPNTDTSTYRSNIFAMWGGGLPRYAMLTIKGNNPKKTVRPQAA